MNTATKTLFFDESGYTGYDLLNPDQPIFCIASSDIGDQEAQAILEGSCPGYQGAEYKFSQFWRRKSRRK